MTLQGEHSAILSTFIKLPFIVQIFVWYIFEWPFYTGFAVLSYSLVKHGSLVITVPRWRTCFCVCVGGGGGGRGDYDQAMLAPASVLGCSPF